MFIETSLRKIELDADLLIKLLENNGPNGNQTIAKRIKNECTYSALSYGVLNMKRWLNNKIKSMKAIDFTIDANGLIVFIMAESLPIELPKPKTQNEVADDEAIKVCLAVLKARHLEGELHGDRFPYLYGTAGCGKSVRAKIIADRLGLPFMGDIVCSEESGLSTLFGYQTVNGIYIYTALIVAFRDGGVVMIDEMDRLNSSLLVALNGLIANGFITLSNGEKITMNKNFMLICAGNTNGQGPTDQYPTARAFDRSTNDRLAKFEVSYDEKYELSLANCMEETKFIRTIHKLRVNNQEKNLGLVVSTRIIKTCLAMARSSEYSLDFLLGLNLLNDLDKSKRDALTNNGEISL